MEIYFSAGNVVKSRLSYDRSLSNWYFVHVITGCQRTMPGQCQGHYSLTGGLWLLLLGRTSPRQIHPMWTSIVIVVKRKWEQWIIFNEFSCIECVIEEFSQRRIVIPRSRIKRLTYYINNSDYFHVLYNTLISQCCLLTFIKLPASFSVTWC